MFMDGGTKVETREMLVETKKNPKLFPFPSMLPFVFIFLNECAM